MSATVAERVALLDEKDPGWWRADASPAIEPDVLEMRSGRRCVLGQRDPEKGFGGRVRDLFRWDSGVLEKAIPYGFYGEHDGGGDPGLFDRESEEINAEWARIIRARRAGAA
jgi:hypothetical protein